MDYLVHHMFYSTLEQYSDRYAIKDDASICTYGAMADYAGHIRRVLLDAGLKTGDRVVINLNHDCHEAILILAISAAGGVFVPVSRMLRPQQVQHIIKDSGARFFCTTRLRRNLLEPFLAECTSLERILEIEDLGGTETFERTSPVIESDLAALLYTSGSTGMPKGVMVSHHNLVAGSEIISEYLGINASDRLLGVLQFSFDYGLNQFLTSMAAGATYRFLEYTFPNTIVDVLKSDEITGFAAVPHVWISLVNSILRHTDLPHLRYITNSGGAVPVHVVDFLRLNLPHTRIFLMYGLTEAFRSTYLPPDALSDHLSSMGHAIPNTEILVLNEDGKECEPHEPGELVHRGPTVSLGYWNRPEDTAEVFREWSIEGTGGTRTETVVYSGDIVYRDEDGFLYFVGRRDAMIKSCGYRISPTEIEDVAYRTGLVTAVAAVGIPDPTAGQLIGLFVVPAPDQVLDNNALRLAILSSYRKSFPHYMIPRHVAIVSELPKTPHGKTDYNMLKLWGSHLDTYDISDLPCASELHNHKKG